MLSRTRLLSLLAAALAFSAPAQAANLDGSSEQVGNAEAVRLYSEANDFVGSMAEGEYSYAYLQFYWKRAQSNVDRVRRVYPQSPTALAMARGDLKLGPFALDYFKDRVLYNLEVKRIAAYDDVNCAIFLYGRSEARNDAKRDEALADILEVLARRQRWGEALRFPVLQVHRPLLLSSIFRVAATYGDEHIVKKMIADTTAAERQAAGFNALLAEGIALQGNPRADLYAFVRDHPEPSVRTAALKGIVEREILIHRYERLHISYGDTIQTVHLAVQHTLMRDDVRSVAPQLFNGDLDAAGPQLAVYAASLGTAPRAKDSAEAHLAYLQFLADSGRTDDAASYVRDNGLSGPARRACELKVIETYAEAAQTSEAEAARKAFGPDFSPEANDAALAEFRGRMDSSADPLTAREKTFADLPISDPCVMATAITEWSLTPNRSQRGATPWDAVVTRFAGGFTNLPKPKSAAVGDAASTLKPY
jgi:hypothetical protein